MVARGQAPTTSRAAARSLPKVARASAEPRHWRDQGYGYWLLVVAGLGIFCGCVGKSAQFPLHVWLPDAMEGPTPVSALIHAATMVAAGVYLVGRCYPIFTPEVLLVIAYAGCITLFIAATIAITATDIKRVLAYSTVSQLGYMMLALGVGGWLAGMFHLFTHAFFKALLFLCSGSVIHATGTNEMPQMGGLRQENALDRRHDARRLPGDCRGGRAAAGRPERLLLERLHPRPGPVVPAGQSAMHGWFFWVAVGGAAMTAFYMFRLWYLTFAGQPRDEHVYHHAHESPCDDGRAAGGAGRVGGVAPAGTCRERTWAWRRCWSRPGRRAPTTGPRPAGIRRRWSIPPSTSPTRT